VHGREGIDTVVDVCVRSLYSVFEKEFVQGSCTVE
jgi:hypothetical protein